MRWLRIKYITWQEMNEHLDYCRKYRAIFVNEKQDPHTAIGNRAFVEDKLINFSLTYKKGSQVTTYTCRKDELDGTQFTNGVEAYSILQHYYKCPDMRLDKRICNGLLFDSKAGKFLVTARPLLYANPKYDKTRNNAYGYDINSSYSYAMLNKMPDTSVPFRSGTVKTDEIGFRENGEGNFVPVFEGHFSLWIFPLMESPFKRFVETWYKRKVNSKDDNERIKAKGILNYCIGYLQRTNPFLRATIIYYANKKIEDLIDNDTLYCNTDAIISLKPLDLDIGPNIGQFKVEHKGKFAYNGYNYQWNNDIPSYRHISKAWFKKDFDILKDEPPKTGNTVQFVNNRLEEINYEKRKK